MKSKIINEFGEYCFICDKCCGEVGEFDTYCNVCGDDVSEIYELPIVNNNEQVEGYNKMNNFKIISIKEIIDSKFRSCLLVEANPIELMFGGVSFNSNTCASTVRIIYSKTNDNISYLNKVANSSFLKLNLTDFYQESRIIAEETINVCIHDSAISRLNDPEVYNDMGVAYNENQNYFKAKSSFLKAIEIDPDYVLAYTNLGSLYYEQKDYEKAISLWDKAIGIDSDYDGELYNSIGLAYAKLHFYEKAIDSYLKGIESEGDIDELFTNLANTYVQIKEYDNAINCYVEIIDLYSNYPEPYINMGNVYALMSKNEKAIDCWKKAIEINSNLDNIAEIYEKIGSAFYNLKKYNDAAAYYEKVGNLRSKRDSNHF